MRIPLTLLFASLATSALAQTNSTPAPQPPIVSPQPAMPSTEAAVPNTEAAVPNTEAAVPNTEPAAPNTQAAVPSMQPATTFDQQSQDPSSEPVPLRLRRHRR